MWEPVFQISSSLIRPDMHDSLTLGYTILICIDDIIFLKSLYRVI